MSFGQCFEGGEVSTVSDLLWEGVPEGGGRDGEGSVTPGPVLGLGIERRLASDERRLREGVWWWSRSVRWGGGWLLSGSGGDFEIYSLHVLKGRGDVGSVVGVGEEVHCKRWL